MFKLMSFDICILVGACCVNAIHFLLPTTKQIIRLRCTNKHKTLTGLVFVYLSITFFARDWVEFSRSCMRISLIVFANFAKNYVKGYHMADLNMLYMVLYKKQSTFL